MTRVKIRGYANLVSSLLAYLISAVASWFSNSILSRFRMLLQIVCHCNITLFSIARKVLEPFVVKYISESLKYLEKRRFFQECLLKCDRGRV